MLHKLYLHVNTSSATHRALSYYLIQPYISYIQLVNYKIVSAFLFLREPNGCAWGKNETIAPPQDQQNVDNSK